MGKRKDRRLPAGRRVKLDLFAEPSGDASFQDEVNGGEDDSKSRAGLTKSPSSSSDQQPENPLVLLGQYSDDELDEESSKNINDTIVENFLADLDDQQAKDAADKDFEENNASKVAAEKVQEHDVEKVLVSHDILGTPENSCGRVNDYTDLQNEDDTAEPVSVNCEVQVDGDVTSGWKLVHHEESDKYYYWNVVTGETSWDFPCGQTDAATEVEKNVLGIELEHGHVVTSLPSDENLNCEISQDLPEMEVSNEGHACDAPDSKSEALDADVNISCSPSGQPNSPAKKQLHECILGDGEDAEVGTNFSSSILKHGEYLLEKLSSLKSSLSHLNLKEQISNHIMEVELRLHDIKSLSSYGSSLLPFWQHSQGQLNRIEATFNVLLQSSEIDKASHCGGDEIIKNSEDNSTVKVSQILEDDKNAGVDVEHSKTGQNGEGLAELSSTAAFQAEEDMDVDMEVEDIPNPPPPVDDWIPPPPPPPDSESIPPPPPESTLESTFPLESTFLPPQPSEADTFSYTHQYGQTCPVPSYELYAQTTTVPASGYYSIADGQQLAAPFPIYYNTYPVESASYYDLQDPTGSATSVCQSHVQVGSTSLPQSKIDDSSVGVTTTSYSSAFVEAPSATTMTPLVTETVPKVQSKGRTKKKAIAVVSTLRSNKKVSSLVDKWKAAKDELQEEDDEPENALEMLEKKRKREIEEWRAQQIASGEAKDNANFQPLGGDWRERVKRRKAQMVKESSSLSEEEDRGDGDAKQGSADVAQVSKGLPSGWKAYWDESSKLFYYANSLTSETTWIKPTS